MKRLGLEEANSIIEHARHKAREMRINPLTIVVLDPSGNLIAAQREDGASMFRFDIAVGKAWGAVAMGSSSRALARRAKENPNFFLTLAATAQGRFLPQPGAVLIKDAEGQVLGATAASGATGEEDETACAHGVRAAGFNPDAGP